MLILLNVLVLMRRAGLLHILHNSTINKLVIAAPGIALILLHNLSSFMDVIELVDGRMGWVSNSSSVQSHELTAIMIA